MTREMLSGRVGVLLTLTLRQTVLGCTVAGTNPTKEGKGEEETGGPSLVLLSTRVGTGEGVWIETNPTTGRSLSGV